MKDENPVLSITVSNKQTAMAFLALIGYPAYFGLPANPESEGYSSQYVVKLEHRIEQLETDVAQMDRSMALVTAMQARVNRKIIEGTLDD